MEVNIENITFISLLQLPVDKFILYPVHVDVTDSFS